MPHPLIEKYDVLSNLNSIIIPILNLYTFSDFYNLENKTK
jgi:hypothetical protein